MPHSVAGLLIQMGEQFPLGRCQPSHWARLVASLWESCADVGTSQEMARRGVLTLREARRLVSPQPEHMCSLIARQPVPDSAGDTEFADVSDLESKPAAERWKHFKEELSKCIRCYACKNVCPLCYCKTCFVDQTMPAWFGKTTDLSDTLIYHIVRAFHVAGRCVGCGACSRACPMDIDLSELLRKTEKIMKERYNYEAGLSLQEVPPLGEFSLDDSQEFIQ